MSISNESSPRSNDDRILDAVRACVAEFGVKRTTLAEVARRAGVSRPTIYRRWPDTRTLIAELLNREIVESIAPPTRTDVDARAQLVAAVVEVVAAIQANVLFDKLFRTDTDLMLTYVVERLGRSQRDLIKHFALAIARGHRDGSIQPGDPTEMATMLLLIAQSAVQSGRMVAGHLPGDRLRRELTRVLDGYLRPYSGGDLR